MWDNLTQREQVMILFLLVIIIIVPYYFFIYIPNQEKIANYQERLTDKEQELAIARVYLKKLPDLKKELNELQQEDAKYMLHGDYSDEGLLHYLLDKTEEYDLTLLTYIPKEKGNEFSFEGVLEGEYDNLILFLKDFENVYWEFTYNNLEMRPQEDLVSLRLSSTYMEKQQSGGDNS